MTTKTMEPPGRVLDRHAHGPTRQVTLPPYGEAHLRTVLGLSGDVPIEQVCDEAAMTIEQYREHGDAGPPPELKGSMKVRPKRSTRPGT